MDEGGCHGCSGRGWVVKEELEVVLCIRPESRQVAASSSKLCSIWYTYEKRGEERERAREGGRERAREGGEGGRRGREEREGGVRGRSEREERENTFH